MPLYEPQQLEAIVEARARELGTREFMTGRKHQRLREMWCAARFGLGYGGSFGDCAIDIENRDEQREYDFHLLVPGGRRLPFQLTEVLDPVRRRGDEYRHHTSEEVAGMLARQPARDSWYAAQRVRLALRYKLRKRYAGFESLHMLLYVNLKASVPWPYVAAAAEEDAIAFASVWLMTRNSFSCIHGGVEWPDVAVGWRRVDGGTSR